MSRVAVSNRSSVGQRFNSSIFANNVSNGGISVPNQSALNPTAAVTVECWVYFFSIGATGSILFDNSTTGVTNSYYLAIGSNGKLLWYSTIGGFSENIIGGSSVISLNSWNHVVGVYDGAHVYLYINGVQDATSLSATGALGTNSNSLYIFQYYSGGLSFENGYMTGIRVYNRGLTPTDVLDRYYKNRDDAAMRTGLVLEYILSNPSSTSVVDTSGNNFTGTFTGASYSRFTPFSNRASANNPNLVYNGGFELAPPFTAATTTVTRWIDGTATGSTTNDVFRWSYRSGIGTDSAQFDSTQFHSGTYSLKLSTLSTAANIQASTYNKSGNPTIDDVQRYLIPVLPNTSYTGTYWMKTNYVSGAATSGAAIRFSEFAAGGGGALVFNTGTLIQTTTGWTQYTITFTTSATTAAIEVTPRIIGSDGTATLIMDAWFDDIVLTPTTPVTRVAVSNRVAP